MTAFQESKSSLFATLPPDWPEDVKPRIRELLAASPSHKLIVLDDDPTGTQTVHDLPILTTWEIETLTSEFNRPESCFYILTNSRSLSAENAEALNREIAANLHAASGGGTFTIVSRSDSTLRGHYPLETDVLDQRLGPFDATFLIPYFEAGGRHTVHDVHYVADGDTLTPAAETPFAQDAVFGYRSSNLREWVEEKTQGRIKADDVASVSLETIRSGGPESVFEQLMSLPKKSVCIVNSADLRDVDVFALGMLMAESSGRRFLLRSAAQIIAARLGLEPKPLLTAEDLGIEGGCGGLTIVGSYVPKTTEQVSHLLAESDIARIELSVPRVLEVSERKCHLEQVLAVIHERLCAGRDVVVFTSRDLIAGTDTAQNFTIGDSVSAALVEIVQRLTVRPRYLIAKGGITSSDLATKGLGVRRNIVAGQILPGIPVWRISEETKFPGLPYVVFPGNVGNTSALLDVITKLRKSTL
jgi:uncharacterized protein YgbK (DUF1537 family)